MDLYKNRASNTIPNQSKPPIGGGEISHLSDTICARTFGETAGWESGGGCFTTLAMVARSRQLLLQPRTKNEQKKDPQLQSNAPRRYNHVCVVCKIGRKPHLPLAAKTEQPVTRKLPRPAHSCLGSLDFGGTKGSDLNKAHICHLGHSGI